MMKMTGKALSIAADMKMDEDFPYEDMMDAAESYPGVFGKIVRNALRDPPSTSK